MNGNAGTDEKGGEGGICNSYFAGNGSLGFGGDGVGFGYWGSGGGGGYYGGGGSYEAGGGGGSGFVLPFLHGKTMPGNVSFIQPNGSNRIGKEGDGFARIVSVDFTSHRCPTSLKHSLFYLFISLVFS